jgi:hypothetical protein
MILLMSVGYSPLAIYAPLFLQRLHGVSPLSAGYHRALHDAQYQAELFRLIRERIQRS